MNHTVTVEEWVKARLGTEVIELPKLAVEEQLRRYDEAGSGIGFILLLEMVTADADGEYPEATQFNLASVPAVKLCGSWMTVDDENLADILAGVVRLVAPTQDVPNTTN